MEVNSSLTVLQACGLAGIYIPRFCYHEKLSIVGSCRICLVELYKSLKPVIACATPVFKDIEIYTETALSKNSREHVLEFLLINHPLDCPICDQGGECDLQDQSLVYGSDRGRFKEKKRAVINKDFGPFIKTMMTRCIHCTRCVRFMSEVAGDDILGTLGRGKDMEIGTYINAVLRSEISGNIIDICPVGALTSKPFAFTNRSWELRSVESVDILDGMGSSIRLDFRGSEIVRILPIVNELTNEHWITDKIRFTYDGFKYSRLITPLLRKKRWHNLKELPIAYLTGSWETSIFFLISLIVCFMLVFSVNKLNFIVGELVDLQTVLILMQMSNFLGSSNLYFSINNLIQKQRHDIDLRENYLLNVPVSYFETGSAYLFLGSNLQLESPLLNIRLNKVSIHKKLIIFFGSFHKSMHNGYHLGVSVYNVLRILNGKHFLCKQLLQHPTLLWISNLYYSHMYSDFNSILSVFSKYTKLANKYSLIHNDCNKVGIFDLGTGLQYKQITIYNNDIRPSVKLYYCLIDPQLTVKHYNNNNNVYVIYQGHHSVLDESQRISLFLPSTSFIEKHKKYINNSGKILFVRKAVVAPGLSKDDTSILSIINLILKHCSNSYIKEDLILLTYIPHLFVTLLTREVYLYALLWSALYDLSGASLAHFYNVLNATKIDNYYKTNLISIASKILGKVKITLNNYDSRS